MRPSTVVGIVDLKVRIVRSVVSFGSVTFFVVVGSLFTSKFVDVLLDIFLLISDKSAQGSNSEVYIFCFIIVMTSARFLLLIFEYFKISLISMDACDIF